MRLIDADTLVGQGGLFSKRGCPGNCQHCSLWSKEGCRVILEAPIVDAMEVVHGEWLPMYNVDWIYGKEWLTDYICTQCGGLNKKKSPYCPNCGAKMDGDI